MGVGNYSIKCSTGVSFSIDGPLGRQEDYQAYCNEAEEPLDFDTWAAQESEDHAQLLEETIDSVRAQLGLSEPASDSRFSGDGNLRCMASGLIEIGFGGWEHDHVIAVAPEVTLDELIEDSGDFNEEEYSRNPDGLARRMFEWHHAAEQLVESYGMPAPITAWHVMDAVNNIKKLLILALQEEGLRCSFPTSAWSSASYEALSPDLNRKEQERLVKAIKGTLELLAKPPAEVVKTLSAVHRETLLKMADHSRLSSYKEDLQKLHILVPYAVKGPTEEKTYINLFDLTTNQVLCTAHVPDSLQEYLKTLQAGDGDDVVSIPDSPELEEWWSALREKGLAQPLKYNENYLYASADEVASVWRDDVVMAYTDDDGEDFNVILAEWTPPVAAVKPADESPSP